MSGSASRARRSGRGGPADVCRYPEHRGPGAGTAVAVLIVLFAAIGAASVWTIARWMSTGRVEFVNPVAGVMGREPWTATHTAAAIAVGVVVLAVIVGAVVLAVRASRDRSPADRAAPYMGKGRSIAPLLPGALAKKHKRMGLDVRRFRGVLVGYAVLNATALRASYEDTITVIAGPRRNKSVSIVIPAIVEAPGSLLVTGNKPDLMVTAGHRATMGRVSLFDPQGLAAAHTDNRCWWNPFGDRPHDRGSRCARRRVRCSVVRRREKGRLLRQERPRPGGQLPVRGRGERQLPVGGVRLAEPVRQPDARTGAAGPVPLDRR